MLSSKASIYDGALGPVVWAACKSCHQSEVMIDVDKYVGFENHMPSIPSRHNIFRKGLKHCRTIRPNCILASAIQVSPGAKMARSTVQICQIVFIMESVGIRIYILSFTNGHHDKEDLYYVRKNVVFFNTHPTVKLINHKMALCCYSTFPAFC